MYGKPDVTFLKYRRVRPSYLNGMFWVATEPTLWDIDPPPPLCRCFMVILLPIYILYGSDDPTCRTFRARPRRSGRLADRWGPYWPPYRWRGPSTPVSSPFTSTVFTAPPFIEKLPHIFIKLSNLVWLLGKLEYCILKKEISFGWFKPESLPTKLQYTVPFYITAAYCFYKPSCHTTVFPVKMWKIA